MASAVQFKEPIDPTGLTSFEAYIASLHIQNGSINGKLPSTDPSKILENLIYRNTIYTVL